MTDDSGLKYLFRKPNLNARQDKWLAMLNEFDFKIKYMKGKENKVVDALSKRIQAKHLAIARSYVTNMDENTKNVGQ